jgi:hypothetical protein
VSSLPYHEPKIIDEDGEETILPGAEYIQQLDPSPYRSNENAFVKHLTERHIPADFGDEHKKQWLHRTVYSGKERSTAFFEDPRSLQFINASLKNLNLIETLNIEELKWPQVYDMVDMSVTTHGQHGNMIKSLTIKRQEFTDKSRRDEKKNLLSGFLKKEEPPQPEQGMVPY